MGFGLIGLGGREEGKRGAYRVEADAMFRSPMK